MGPIRASVQAHTDLLKGLWAGAVIESEARPAGVQPKREAMLLTRDWFNYYIFSKWYYIYSVPYLYISKNYFTNLSGKIIARIYCFLIYLLSHHKSQVPIGLCIEEI